MIQTIRHMELFNPDYFNDNINIIGVGATGSWLALQFAKLGIKGSRIKVWDFDVIEEHNIANQAFPISAIGEYKVDALAEMIKDQTGAEIEANNRKFENERISGYVFLMVDSMSERKRIWEQAVKMKSAVKLLVEPRMGLDMGRIYNVSPMNMSHVRSYEDTFYTDEEAETSACGASQSVITTSSAIASLCARQLVNMNNELELDNEILIDFMYNNLMTEVW